MKKTKVIRMYCESLFYNIVKTESAKRNVSMSDFLSNSVYEYIYRPNLRPKNDVPILRVDRTPKGAKDPVMKANFGKVMNELKSKIAAGQIKKIGVENEM